MLTNGGSKMFDQMNLWDTGSATSSLALEDGPTPCKSQAGPMIGPCGPDPVRVSLSPSQAKEAGLTTREHYGGLGDGLSTSADLQKSLENRLQARLVGCGSPEYALTWKRWDMEWGGADLCAAGVGAPHIRQRLWWVAHRDGEGCSEQWSGELLDGQRPAQRDDTDGCSEVRGLAHREQSGLEGHAGNVADGHEPGRQRAHGSGFWQNAVWIECADGKARRIEPGLEPLAHGIPGRVGLLRGYGNAIVPQVAATFVKSFMEIVQ